MANVKTHIEESDIPIIGGGGWYRATFEADTGEEI